MKEFHNFHQKILTFLYVFLKDFLYILLLLKKMNNFLLQKKNFLLEGIVVFIFSITLSKFSSSIIDIL